MEVTSGVSAFPLPSEIADAPGAEGWRRMDGDSTAGPGMGGQAYPFIASLGHTCPY